jgi:hypothetical protein
MDKDHILNEIRRTALANGGEPLGRKRFLAETGIKESDWLGKIWTRWSTAVEEAGFSPLTLQGKNDRTLAIAKVAELARKLGHFPTAPEMRMEKRRDSSFPNEKTVTSSAGNKDALVAEVLAFCQSTPDFEDVQRILIDTLPTRKQREVGEAGSDKTRDGYVYLLRSGKKYKIGYAIAPLSRAMVISNMTPDGADRLHEIRTDDPRGIEAYWHNRFADKRGNGEWFALTAADVAAFKRRKFM